VFALQHLATDGVVGDLADVEAADADSSAAAACRRHRAGRVVQVGGLACGGRGGRKKNCGSHV
jgi:hypothetical protein